MPRPKKIVQEEVVIPEALEITEVEDEPSVQDEVIDSEGTDDVIEIMTDTEIVEEKKPTIFRVYHLGNLLNTVEEDSDTLNSYLEANRIQLYNNIDKLKVPTSDQEDLVLFNIPATDNRKYNSLQQFYQQNGLAPQPPKIRDWMTFYKSKYPFATEEEIAIQVFGPLDYSFEIAD